MLSIWIIVMNNQTAQMKLKNGISLQFEKIGYKWSGDTDNHSLDLGLTRSIVLTV